MMARPAWWVLGTKLIVSFVGKQRRDPHLGLLCLFRHPLSYNLRETGGMGPFSHCVGADITGLTSVSPGHPGGAGPCSS